MKTIPTVLVVDDEPDLADLYAAWLGESYDTRIANSGEAALEQFDEMVDVVLLDRNLPDVSGDDVLVELRRHSETPIAFVSAVDPTPDILSLPVDAYRQKPVSQMGLVETVEELLDWTRLDEKRRRRRTLRDKLHQIDTAQNTDLREILDDTLFDLEDVKELHAMVGAEAFVADD